MVQDCAGWFRMVQDGAGWCRMVQAGAGWPPCCPAPLLPHPPAAPLLLPCPPGPPQCILHVIRDPPYGMLLHYARTSTRVNATYHENTERSKRTWALTNSIVCTCHTNETKRHVREMSTTQFTSTQKWRVEPIINTFVSDDDTGQRETSTPQATQ